MFRHEVSGEFMINPPKWWQRWSCRLDINHWPWLHGPDKGKCRWCSENNLGLDSQGNHYRQQGRAG